MRVPLIVIEALDVPVTVEVPDAVTVLVAVEATDEVEDLVLVVVVAGDNEGVALLVAATAAVHCSAPLQLSTVLYQPLETYVNPLMTLLNTTAPDASSNSTTSPTSREFQPYQQHRS